jgi:glycosyltransferase involved in cell wall biosynthesis
MIRVLTFTTLYPNAAQPVHGVFVENRIRHLAASGEVAIEVVAPVPWFPFASRHFGRYAAFARAPRRESRSGLTVHHPRYPVIPKLGMTVAPLLLYRAVRPFIAELIREGQGFDLIDAHYFYPDGVAASLLGRHFGLPVVITARGTDVNVIPRNAMARRQILDAAGRAAGMIAVCADLKRILVELGAAPERVRVLRNGVDLKQFHPVDRGDARRRYGVAGPTIVSVGGLIPRKGHDLTIAALAELPGVTLLIAGEGPERAALADLAAKLGVADRVRLLGRVDHGDLPALYSAADAMVLASSFEGWANVLLESMACGTPVLATDAGGTAEVMTDPAAGILLARRSVQSVVDGMKRLLADPPQRSATRAYAEQFDWDATTKGQVELFGQVLAASPPRPLT